MDDAKYQELQKLEANLAGRLKVLNHDLSVEHSPNWPEQAIERENEDVLLRVQEETQSELQQVRAALKRISEGEYGICSECGQAIGSGRLAALPYATLCIECAERLEH